MIQLATCALVLIFLGVPLVAEPQPGGGVPRIGWLTGSVIHEPNVNAFREGMRGLGYSHVEIEFRAAGGHAHRLPTFAAELVRLRLDAILVDGGAAAIAAKRTISDVPVVIGAMGGDPIREGIAASLARPGGNITGFSLSAGPELVGKRLELLREIVPGLAKAAVVWNEGNPTSRLGLEAVTDAGRTMGIAVVPFGALDVAGISRAFADAARNRVGAIITLSDAFFWSQRDHIAATAARLRLPTIYPETEFVTAGGLIAYGTNVPDNFRRAAAYVDKILKGARPGDLPFDQPTRFDLFVNLRTARALGLAIPQLLLLRADRVIE